MRIDRRSVLRGAGVAIGGSLFSTTGAGAGKLVDDALNTASEELQEALFVLQPGADYGFFDHYSLPAGRFEMEALDIVYAKATGPEIDDIAGHHEVQYVQANHEIDYDNGDAQIATKSGVTQDGLGYTGRGVHVAVIDSGLDAYHPDLLPRLANHYQFVNPLEEGQAYVDASYADTDDIGHGTHCAGTVCGEGTIDSDHEGMAPDARLTVYSQGVGLFILSSVAAFNHLLTELHPNDPVHITSNSYGSTGGNDFNPSGGWERATWRAFEEGILSIGSAGNSGPGTNTLGGSKTGPHTLSVAASHDGQGNEGMDDTKKPTNFSSRGRKATYEGGEGARWDEFPAENGGFTGLDRKTALQNLRAFNADIERPIVNEFEESVTVGPGVDASSQGGPDTGTSEFVEYQPSEDTAYLDASLSWPDGVQDVDCYLHKGAEDGEVVASSTNGNTTSPSPGGGGLETVATDVDTGATYYFEVDPWAAVNAQVTISIVEKGPAPEVDLPGDPEGDLGVYRPGVIAPGNAVISTQGASALKALDEEGPTSTETGPLYTALSGTSMSCPVTAGIAAQVMEAWYTNNGEEYPDPEQVIRILEGTAEANAEDSYTPYNAGAGFVNARRAVKAAIAGEVPGYTDITLPAVETDDGEDGTAPVEELQAAGSRTHDSTVYTAGQVARIDITVSEASHDVTVSDTIPDGWIVDPEVADVTEVDGNTVVLDPVSSDDVAEDDPVTRTYIAEAPSGATATGGYTFGPAVAVAEIDDQENEQEITGTQSSYVAGVDT